MWILRTLGAITLLCIGVIALAACGDSAHPDGDAAADGGAPGNADTLPEVDYDLHVPDDATERPISRALLGQYDLSGALYDNDLQPGLVDTMAAAGFSEWRVSVGRWEAGTLLLPSLTDTSPCNFPLDFVSFHAYAVQSHSFCSSHR